MLLMKSWRTINPFINPSIPYICRTISFFSPALLEWGCEVTRLPLPARQQCFQAPEGEPKVPQPRWNNRLLSIPRRSDSSPSSLWMSQLTDSMAVPSLSNKIFGNVQKDLQNVLLLRFMGFFYSSMLQSGWTFFSSIPWSVSLMWW